MPDPDNVESPAELEATEQPTTSPRLGVDENGFDLRLPYDDAPGPFVISPFNQGTRPRPGQMIAKGL